MPTVPRPARQVRTAALPGVRLQAAETPLSLGAGVEAAKAQKDQALAGLGETVANVSTNLYAQKQAEATAKANELWTIDATAKMDQVELAMHDPQTGLFATRKGQSAVTVPGEMSQTWDEAIAAIGQGAGNDAQRVWLEKQKVARGFNLQLSAQRHVDGELTEYGKSLVASTVKNKSNLAIINALDPPVADLHMSVGVATIINAGKMNGAPQEAIDASVDDFRSKTMAGIITTLANRGQLMQAKVYFQEHQGTIDGDTRGQLSKMLEQGSTLKEAQQAADSILAAGGTLAEQRAKAKEIEDPKVRDEALQQIEHEFDVTQKLERQTSEDRLRGVYDILDATKSTKKIPLSMWSQMDGNERASARRYAEALVEGPGSVKTDPGHLYDLLTLSSTNHEQFLKTNLLQYKNVLSQGDLEQMMRMQVSMRDGGTKDSKLFVSEKNQNAMVDDALTALHLDYTPAELRKPENKAVVERVDQYRRAVREAVQRHEAQTGKPTSDSEMQAIVDQLIVPSGSKTTGGFLGLGAKTTPVYRFETPEAHAVAIATVPAAERVKIIEALQRNGRRVTEDAIQHLWEASH